MKNRYFLLLMTFIICAPAGAQKWVEMMQDPHGNYYKTKAEFETYWSTRDVTEKGKGYKAFKRWENFVERRVYPSGDLSLLNQTAENFEKFMAKQPSANNVQGKALGGSALLSSATWTPMGPFGAISGSQKSGRLNFITVDPTNTLNLWVGAPAGGLWSTTNGGTTWTTNTDQLGVIGCSDLAIDPTNTNILYLATGDGDAGDTRSIGVLKSTNGGSTWSSTGLVNPVSTNFLIRKLIINPSNTQILLAATNFGIYRTTNGGTSWTLVSSQGTYDLEFKPGDPNTVYAGGNTFLLSTNGGVSFTTVVNGLTPGSFQRVAVAVTPADPNYVYVLGSNGTNSGFLGLYRSVVGGTLFSVMSTSATINILGWNSNGGDIGGQGWYDLSLAASPLNRDEIVTGGVNVWHSLDGGTNWSIYGHWTGNLAPFIHADQHDLEYASNGTLFCCNDGTAYRRGATTWTEISGTMNISQIYKIGLSSLTPNKWITGHQDNGTNRFSGTAWQSAIGGDGMDCFIDRTNDQNMFGSLQNGNLQRSTNGGSSWNQCISGLTGSGPWVTIWKQDPQNATTLYAGYSNLFKSTNLAVSWTTLTPMPQGGSIVEFAIAPSNNLVIYVLKSSGIYKTTNGGTTWSTVTSNVPVGAASPQYITIDPTDPNNAWVVLSGYSSGNKVFVTTNGGTSWTNVSSNLPNLPANCSVYQAGSNDMIYIGMDVGIYFKDNASTNWTLYNAGLPNVPVHELQISPATPTLLHAATYGRGVWVASVYSVPGVPNTLFSIPPTGVCAATSITFTDLSTNTPTAWAWTVTPAAGVIINSPASQNPTITFSNPGNYTVSLQATNSVGQGTVYAQTVTINPTPVLNIAIPSQTVCSGKQVVFSASGSTSYSWSNGGGSASSATFFPLSSTIYTLTGTSNSCTIVKTATASTFPIQPVTISGKNNVCSGDLVTLTASGAVSYTWAGNLTGTTVTVTPFTTTNYSVSGTGSNGCASTAFFVIGVFPLPPVGISASDSTMCEGEDVTLTAYGAGNYTWSPGNITASSINFPASASTIYTVTGQDVNGCFNTAVSNLVVMVCEGIGKFEISRNSSFSVFPNPTKGKVNIKCRQELHGQVKADVVDAEGRIVSHQSLHFTSEDGAEINLANLQSGTYLIRITSRQGVEVIKVVKD
jgi:photosystem II stability/assembly factor-like uncharacterized protein